MTTGDRRLWDKPSRRRTGIAKSRSSAGEQLGRAMQEVETCPSGKGTFEILGSQLSSGGLGRIDWIKFKVTIAARAIARHAPEETDPDVLLRIARSGSSPEFYRSLVRLLSSTDAKVRESALFFVYLNLSNEYTAPMWKLGFNQEVYERVRKLSHSASQQERESSMKALNQLDLLKQGISR